ncbi:MAG: hypothetical protein R3A13_06650 [Bdellovibrionota bacterium]
MLKAEGRVAMRNGHTLRRDEGAFQTDFSQQRTLAERAFESALMEYANRNKDYLNALDYHIDPRTSKRSQGLSEGNPTNLRSALW